MWLNDMAGNLYARHEGNMNIVRIIIISLAVLLPAVSVAATVPTGIPEPPFGLDETVANTVGSGSNDYYTYWVDNSGSCTDTANDGSPGNPRCTFPTDSSLTAGDVVQVRGGPYTFTSDYIVTGTGTAGSPIWIRGPDYDNRISINLNTAYAIAATGSYVVYENFKFYNQDEITAWSGSDHCVIRYCELQGTGTAADGNGQVIKPYNSTYLVAAYNVVHDCGDWQSASENDMHGLGTGSSHSYTWYLYNTVYHMGGDGVGNSHDANHTTHHVYVGGNTFYDCRENCIDLKELHDVVITENECYGIQPTGTSSGGAGFTFHYGSTTDDGPYNIWVANNKIHDCYNGIITNDVATDVYIIGNVLYNMDVACINPDRGGGYVYVYHNTSADSAAGIYSGGSGAALTAFESKGNLVAYITNDDLNVFSSDVRALADITNELYYDSVSIDWGTTYSSVAAWIAGTSVGDNSIEQNPLFTNRAGDDYSIQSGSPCEGAGIDMSTVMSAFGTAFPGASLNKDIAGNTRPSGVWDIGAYQVAGAATSAPVKVGVGAPIDIGGSVRIDIQ